MPTAARLFAAFGFAFMAFFASESFVFELPEGTDPGWFSYINTAIGAICGWRVMGKLAGEGYYSAMTSGLRTMAVFMFFTLGGHCLAEMIRLATKLRYEGPGDAIMGMFAMILDYGLLIVTSVPVMLILFVGSVLAAWLSEWASHRWN